mgnify:FL=1
MAINLNFWFEAINGLLIMVIDSLYFFFCCSSFIFNYYSLIHTADIFDVVAPQDGKLKYDCVGGGRIEHSPEKKIIHIYGYSQGFGQADHKISCDLVAKKYLDYKVTWSNEGY